jgi:hypothetical protein
MMNTIERDAYYIAEEEAARFLAQALNLELGRTLYIGHPYAAPLCATFQFDDCPRELGVQFASARAFNVIALNASLRITAPRRGQVAQALSTLLAAYPFINEQAEALDTLRIRDDGFPAIQPVVAADGDEAWQADIGFIVAFKIRN